MEIENLAPESFRNLAPHRCELHPRLNLLVGDNGEGKTNFLEAVALVAGHPSFRTADLRALPAPGARRATVSAATREAGGGSAGVLAVSVEDGTRHHFWNGGRVGQLQARHRLPAVFLTGTDLARFSGPPAARRRALDRISFVLEPRHARDLAEYDKARGSKARLLAAARAPDVDEIAVWNDAMAAAAGRVAASRRRALSLLAPAFGREAEKLGSAWSGLKIALESDLPPAGDAAEMASAFRDAVREREAEERRAGRCLVGPHRDDVSATVEGIPVRDRASSGENRTLVLAWALAEAAILAEAAGEPPLLAFDDFDSQWDPGVLKTFAAALGDEAQVILTSARPESLRGLPLPGGWLFRMERGRPRREGILGGKRTAPPAAWAAG